MIQKLSTEELAKLEWYDNSTLVTIDKCIRKGFWNRVFRLPGSDTPGVEERVGPGAYFGTCMHAALAKYYGLNGRPLAERQLSASRAFAEEHRKLFPDQGLLDKKHTCANGLDLLDQYIANYEQEDELFRPVETEIGASVPILPRPGETFEPFVYASRTDGLWQRLSYGDYAVVEHKTTSGSVEREIERLRMHRSTEGYVWTWKQLLPEYNICGILINVLGVFAPGSKAKLFSREFYNITNVRLEEWRLETIAKVERWRSLIARTKGLPIQEQILNFDRSTNPCREYSGCGYYDLCYYGLRGADLSKYLPNHWNPLSSD